MSGPKVSVILTSYNKPQFVGKAIESVLQQTMEDFELFVMDDNSTEGTLKTIHPYLSDSRLRFFRSDVKDEERYKKVRYAVLINQALSMAKGTYITYLTDDNIYHKKRLEIMSRFLDRRTGVQVVYSAQKIVELNDNFQVVQSKIRKTKGILTKAAKQVDHCSMMHRRGILEKIYKKYQSYWSEDPEFWGFADAVFWDRINEWSPFYPISEALDVNFRTPLSYKKRHFGLPSFISGETFIPDGTVIRGTTPGIYYMDKRMRRPIIDWKTFQFLRLTASEIWDIPDPQLFQIPRGERIDREIFFKKIPNNLLITSYEQDTIYLIQNGRKRIFVDKDTFRFFGYKKEKVINLPQNLIDSLENGPPLTSTLGRNMSLPNRLLFKCKGCYYLSHDNQLFPVLSQPVLKKLKFPLDKAITIPPHILQDYPLGKGIIYRW